MKYSILAFLCIQIVGFMYYIQLEKPVMSVHLFVNAVCDPWWRVSRFWCFLQEHGGLGHQLIVGWRHLHTYVYIIIWIIETTRMGQGNYIHRFANKTYIICTYIRIRACEQCTVHVVVAGGLLLTFVLILHAMTLCKWYTCIYIEFDFWIFLLMHNMDNWYKYYTYRS